MLVLSRKENEKIYIGDNIVVTVLRMHGNVIRLGFEAPQDVRIVRAELPPLNRSPVNVIKDVDFSAVATESGPATRAAVTESPNARNEAAPLGKFFPRSVELAVANLSV